MDADGTKDGYDIELTAAVSAAVEVPVIASGGVAGIADIHALAAARADFGGRIEGVITGRALYDGRLDLAEALRVARE